MCTRARVLGRLLCSIGSALLRVRFHSEAILKKVVWAKYCYEPLNKHRLLITSKQGHRGFLGRTLPKESFLTFHTRNVPGHCRGMAGLHRTFAADAGGKGQS